MKRFGLWTPENWKNVAPDYAKNLIDDLDPEKLEWVEKEEVVYEEFDSDGGEILIVSGFKHKNSGCFHVYK